MDAQLSPQPIAAGSGHEEYLAWRVGDLKDEVAALRAVVRELVIHHGDIAGQLAERMKSFDVSDRWRATDERLIAEGRIPADYVLQITKEYVDSMRRGGARLDEIIAMRHPGAC
jgi:hypothetical protein